MKYITYRDESIGKTNFALDGILRDVNASRVVACNRIPEISETVQRVVVARLSVFAFRVSIFYFLLINEQIHNVGSE